MDERICPLIPEEEKEEKNLQKNTERKKDDSPSPFRSHHRPCRRRSGARIQSQFLKIKNDFDKFNEKEDNEYNDYNEYNYLLYNDIFYRRQNIKSDQIFFSHISHFSQIFHMFAV